MRKTTLKRAAGVVNTVVLRVLDAPVLGRFARRGLTTVSYTGRRSGRRFSLPVGYRREGDVVTVAVEMPDLKDWWRNFVGEGGPITVDLDGAPRDGHAVARRTGRTVTLRIDLQPV